MGEPAPPTPSVATVTPKCQAMRQQKVRRPPIGKQRKPPIMMTPARPIAPEMDDLPKVRKPGEPGLPGKLCTRVLYLSYPDEP